MNKEELKNNIDVAIQVIGNTLASFNLMLGFDIKNNKGVLMDIDTHKFGEFDLDDLNKEVIRIREEKIEKEI